MRVELWLGASLIPVAVIGAVCNWLILIAICKNARINYSFSLLMANQAIFNGLHCTIYIFYVIPMVMFSLEILISYSHITGFLLFLCYDLSMQAHFFITLNRFLAVFMPVAYTRIFSETSTKVIVFGCFTITILLLIIAMCFQNCWLVYHKDAWIFIFEQHSNCRWFENIAGSLKYTVLSVVNVSLDVLTVWKARRKRNVARKNKICVEMEKKELEFLKKSCGQTTFCLSLMFLYLFGGQFFENNVLRFFFATFGWSTFHALEGVLTLSFNSEIKITLSEVCPSLAKVFRNNDEHWECSEVIL